MTGTELSVVLWGLTTTASVTALYLKQRSDIRHLEETKETKNGLSTAVNDLTVEVRLANQKLDEQGRKIETIFDKAPCFQPNFKRGDC